MLKHTILVAAVAGLVLAMAPAAQAEMIVFMSGDQSYADGDLPLTDQGDNEIPGVTLSHDGIMRATGRPGVVGHDLDGSCIVTMTNNKTLTFSMEVYISSLWLYPGGGQPDGDVTGKLLDGSTAWTFTTTPNIWTEETVDATKAVKSILFEPKYMSIDGITGVPVPEPATLALLALGGVGMLISRKRK